MDYHSRNQKWTEIEFQTLLNYIEDQFESFPYTFFDCREMCYMYARNNPTYPRKPLAIKKKLCTKLESESTESRISIQDRANLIYRLKLVVSEDVQKHFQNAAIFSKEGRMIAYMDDQLELGLTNAKLIEFMNSLPPGYNKNLSQSFLHWRIEKYPLDPAYRNTRIEDFLRDLEITDKEDKSYVDIDLGTRVEFLEIKGVSISAEQATLRVHQPHEKYILIDFFDELRLLIVHGTQIQLDHFCLLYKNNKKLEMSEHKLLQLVTGTMARGIIPTSSEIDLHKKVKFYYISQVPLPKDFLSKSRAIYQVDHEGRLIFFTHDGFQLGQRVKDRPENLSSLQSDIMTVLQLKSIRTVDFLDDLIDVLEKSNAVLQGATRARLMEEIEIVKQFMKSEDQSNLFTIFHTHYTCQIPVSRSFRKRVKEYQVIYDVNNCIQKYEAKHKTLRLKKNLKSWILDKKLAMPEIQKDDSAFKLDSSLQTLLLFLRHCTQKTLETHSAEQLANAYIRLVGYKEDKLQKYLEDIQYLKTILEKCQLEPLVKLRLLFMTQVPISVEFQQKYGQRYKIVLDNDRTIAQATIGVHYVIDRHEGVLFSESIE